MADSSRTMPRQFGITCAILALISFGFWWWNGSKAHNATPKRPFFHQHFPLMGTHISLQTPFRQRVEAYAIVRHTFGRIDTMMSEWKKGSPLAKVNQAAGKRAVRVPQELFALLLRGYAIGEMTEGAFDISWAAMWGLWDFKRKPPRVPDQASIHAKRRWVDFKRIQLNRNERTVRLPHKEMKLGLGGIAKGYALDVAARELRQAGVANFLLSAGGHVMVAGRKHGRLWQVGIRDPRGGPDDLLKTLSLTNTSISTSGDYERVFWVKGKRYHHIIDPRTGSPSGQNRSATVMSPDATLADALSTALMILPASKGLEIAKGLPQVRVIIVDGNGQIHDSR